MNRIKWVLFLGVMASGMTQYANAASGGTIHFSGAIVEGVCSFENGGNKVISDSERGNKKFTQVHSIKANNPLAFSLPLSMGKVTTQYINNNPHLAVMTVTYN